MLRPITTPFRGTTRGTVWVVLTFAPLAISCGGPTGNPVEPRVASRSTPDSAPPPLVTDRVPDWAAGAIFYQVFPERFRNGDPSNDPTRESLEWPENVSDRWRVTPWTSDWYERADWEQERGSDFYEHGVFDRRYGGDLQGVLDKLDYIESLGVNAIYFNPVFYARSLHKYDGNSYHHVDPYFGPDPEGDLALMAEETSDPSTWNWTAADRLFLELVDEAHQRGIRVVLDGVFNHTGRDFFAFANLRDKQAESPYRDWYLVQSFDNPETPQNEFRYKGWWGVDTLPEFADNADGDDLHPGPKQYVFDATRRWMDPNEDGDPSDGIDGWRLDVAVEVPIGFWKDWNAHCRQINPQCYTTAEHWENAAEFLAEGGFSATMNYYGFAFPVKGYLIDGTMSPSDAARQLEERMAEFPRAVRYAVQNLIDSHDTDRVASMCVNSSSDRPYLRPDRFDYDVSERASPRHWGDYDPRMPNDLERSLQRMVAVMQASFVGAPMVYYGDEAGMWGGDDPCDRMPMVWSDLKHEPQRADPLGRPREPDAVRFNEKVFGLYQAAMWFRRNNSVLQRGDFEIVMTDDATGALVFRRWNEHHSMLVAFNRSEEEQPLRVELPGGGEIAEAFTSSGHPEKIRLKHSDGVATITMPPLEAAIFEHFPAP